MPHRLERDDFSSNRHLALSFCLSMISATNAFRVCREGKPLHTFPDHTLAGLTSGRHSAVSLDALAYCVRLRPRKSRIAAAISCTCVSSAKWPVS